MDCVERGLKKGRGGEQEAAARLVVLVALQLGSVGDSEAIYKEQKHTLLSVIADRSMVISTRAQVNSTSMLKLKTFLYIHVCLDLVLLYHWDVQLLG